MRIYISGPMTGRPNLNFPLFNDVTLALRMGGWNVVNPAELCTGMDADWSTCMRKDIAALVKCDGIVMLPGWEESRGAKLEHRIAVELGMYVFSLAGLLTELPASIPRGPAIQALVSA